MTFRPKAFLIDLSGTLHIENKALPGAIDAVQMIKASKIPCLFVTNTTKVRSNMIVVVKAIFINF